MMSSPRRPESLPVHHHSRHVMEASKLRSRLIQLKYDALLTDVTITCHGASFPVHKCVIAASSLFFKLLFTGQHSNIVLHSFDMSNFCSSPEILNNILEFAYMGAIDLDIENIASVADVAYFLSMEDLLEVCGVYFNEVLSKDTCLGLYVALYKMESARREDVATEPEMMLTQVAWDMLESCFYDHVIMQEEILTMSTADIFHLVSRGIVKHFSVERVLQFICRWLNYRNGAEKFEVVEMFINLAYERQQLDKDHAETVDRTNMDELFNKLEDLLKIDYSQPGVAGEVDAKANILAWMFDLKLAMYSKTGDGQDKSGDDQDRTGGGQNKTGDGQDKTGDSKDKIKSELDEKVKGDVDDETAAMADDIQDDAVGKKDADHIYVTGGRDIAKGLEVKDQHTDIGDMTGGSGSGDCGLDDTNTMAGDEAMEGASVQHTEAGQSAEADEVTADLAEPVKDDTVSADHHEMDVDSDVDVADDVLDDSAMEEEEMLELDGSHSGEEMNKEVNEINMLKARNQGLYGRKTESIEQIVEQRIKGCLLSQNLIKTRKYKKRGPKRRLTKPPRKKVKTENDGSYGRGSGVQNNMTELKVRTSKRQSAARVKKELEEETEDGKEDEEVSDRLLMANLYTGDYNAEKQVTEAETGADMTEDFDDDGVNGDEDEEKGNEVNKAVEQLKLVKELKRADGTYECNICYQVLKTLKTIKNHMNSHAGIKPYRCMVCGMIFGRSHHLMRHTLRKHMEAGVYSCDECDAKFTHAKDLNAHSRRHADNTVEKTAERRLQMKGVDEDGNKTFTCSVCLKDFKRADHLRKHVRTHTNFGLKPYKCDECSLAFRRKTELDKHVDWVHVGKRPKFKCTLCKKPFSNEENFEKHVEVCKRGFQCEICNSFFYRQYHLDRHMAVHTTDKPFECTECDRKFKHEQKLKEHAKTHTDGGTTNNPQVCDICGAVLKDVKYLKRHLDCHKGIRYECTVCNKSYTQPTGLQVHMRIHTGVKPYQCEICSMLFAVKSNLMRHQRRHRGDNKHKCDQCGKGFIMRGDLRRHYTMHTGEKNYECKFCGKKFSTKSKLPQHERIHTGEKPYQCAICGKRFIQSCDKKRHEATHGLTVNPVPRRMSLYEMANGVKEEEEEGADPSTMSMVKELMSTRTLGLPVTMPGEEKETMEDTEETPDVKPLHKSKEEGAEKSTMKMVKDLISSARTLGVMVPMPGDKETKKQTYDVKPLDKSITMRNISNVDSEKRLEIVEEEVGLVTDRQRLDVPRGAGHLFAQGAAQPHTDRESHGCVLIQGVMQPHTDREGQGCVLVQGAAQPLTNREGQDRVLTQGVMQPHTDREGQGCVLVQGAAQPLTNREGQDRVLTQGVMQPHTDREGQGCVLTQGVMQPHTDREGQGCVLTQGVMQPHTDREGQGCVLAQEGMTDGELGYMNNLSEYIHNM